MQRFAIIWRILLSWAVLSSCALFGAEVEASTASTTAAADKKLATEAVAANEMAKRQREVRTPDFLEHLVDSILETFDVRRPEGENTTTHFVIAACLLVAALVLRRVVTSVFFGVFRRLASRTRTTLDDKLFSALEAPVGTLVMLIGMFAALKVLKLSPKTDEMVGYASTVAFSLAIFWVLLRGFSTLLDHAHQLAVHRNKGIAAFMPWIKKTLIAVFVVMGILLVMQSIGINVRAILAGLGLGGLAFALAAQDTLANVFGSIVVAIDQPFRLGEFVQIGANSGAVEDIGLRSTKLRRADKSLVIIPNKTVAAEPIINLARFIRRRVEQVFGLTYDTKPEQMDAIVAEFKRILTTDPDVDPASVMVYFRDLNASSLDIWVVYETPDPDFRKHMTTRQRMNLALMRAVYAQGLGFAFPTKTVHLAGEVAERLAGRPEAAPRELEGGEGAARK